MKIHLKMNFLFQVNASFEMNALRSKKRGDTKQDPIFTETR